MKITIYKAGFSHDDVDARVVSIEFCCNAIWPLLSKRRVEISYDFVKIEGFTELKYCPNCGAKIEFIDKEPKKEGR